jgi:hypothetical protein
MGKNILFSDVNNIRYIYNSTALIYEKIKILDRVTKYTIINVVVCSVLRLLKTGIEFEISKYPDFNCQKKNLWKTYCVLNVLNNVDFIGNIPIIWLKNGMFCHFWVNVLGLNVQSFVLQFVGFTGGLKLMALCQFGFIMDKHVKNKVCSIPAFEGVLHRISI